MTAGMLLLLGMLADAGSEGLGLIRSLDSEDTEAADLCQSISDFLDHIVWLFHDRGCEMIQGHLQAVLAWLSQPHFFLYCGSTKSIGALSSSVEHWRADLTAAYGHLRAWTQHKIKFKADRCFVMLAVVVPVARLVVVVVCLIPIISSGCDGDRRKIIFPLRTRLAKDVLTAEFPDFFVMSSFSVFSLRGMSVKGAQKSSALLRYLDQLGQTWDLPDFKTRFFELLPLAATLYIDGLAPDYLAAWKAAIDRSTKRKLSPESLLFVLQRYAAFGPSTSGIEQSFSRLSHYLSPHRL